MNHKIFSSSKLLLIATVAVIHASLTTPPLHGQSNTTSSQLTPRTEEKAEQILQHAIEAMGGKNYLNVRSTIGRGLFTPYKDGASDVPVRFVDYIVYPDKERTEFSGGGNRVIQTNVGDKGWLYDGAAKTLKDMTPAQVEDFQLAMRTNVDTLLRGAWRKEGAQLSYVGRREAGIGRRNETVRLTYPDGFAVEFEFSAKDRLPAKVLYKKKTADEGEVAEEDRLAQYLTINGILVPFIIDHFRAGVQTSRVNYESIEFNPPIPDALFARPASAKAVK